jgi:signal transduction histidine kinase
MVKRLFDRMANRKRLGFVVAFALLLSSLVLTFISNQRMIQQASLIDRTNKIIHTIQMVAVASSKSESAVRAYLLTKEEKLIRECREKQTEANSALSDLTEYFNDNNTQLENLKRLSALVHQRFSLEEEQLTEFSKQENHISPINLAIIKKGTESMNEIEQQTLKMKNQEEAIWKSRSASVSQYSNFINILDVVSVLLALLLTSYSVNTYNKENADKKKAAEKTKIFRDELENRIKQLAELNKELIELRGLEKYMVTGRIARTIAHEVRNPLTNINLSVEQLESEVGTTDSTAVFFEMIKRNSERINNLVSDLLNSTRVEELKYEEVSINDVLDSSLDLAADRIDLNHIKVVKNYDHDMCKISVDIEKVKIAFLNMIVNAIEAMGEMGELNISTENYKEKCVVKISDNGIGMDKTHMDRLFEPYFTTKEHGNGLGLANSQNIILGHGGSVTAESEPGKGTSFIISFKFS